MSGIAGVVYPNLFYSQSLIDPLLDSMGHRSHDDLGLAGKDVFTHKNLTLGIVGGRIAGNPTHTISAVVDGHIYNYLELKKKLLDKGYILSTSEQEELVVSAYDAWGEDFPRELDGDFSIALFDRKEETLYLIRDRVGVKPLYWWNESNTFLFASEIKALLSTEIVPQTPAKDSLAMYLSLGYIPQDMTPIENVNKLLPAHTLKYSFNKGLSIHQYWSFSDNFLKTSKSSFNDRSAHLDYLIKRSLEKRIIPETHVGCFVSGGVGSAGIAKYLRDKKPHEDIPSFCVGFKGENEADVTAATGFAKQLHLSQNVGLITPKTFMDDIVKSVWYCDEPLSDPTVAATWNLSRLAAWKAKHVFSGMGSDELLAGHGRYTTEEQNSTVHIGYEQGRQLMLRYMIIPVLRLFSHATALSLLKNARSNLWLVSYIRSSSVFTEGLLQKAAPSLSNYFTPDFFIHKFHRLTDIDSKVSSFLYLDFKTRLPDLYIAQYERLTMANGVDWRAPFLDRDIIEYLAKIPEPSSLQTEDTALLMKNLLKDSFPEELINRPKKTRKNFLSTWIIPAGLFSLFQTLRQGSLVESGIIDESWIVSVTSSPKSCEAYFQQLWALLVLEVWFRLFINFPVSTECPNLTIEELLTKT